MITRSSFVAKILLAPVLLVILLTAASCGPGSYTNSWDYPEHVQSVYVQMFDTRSFRRGHEYTFTDAVAKQIEARTPYKIVSDPELADTVLSGQMSSGAAVLAGERYTGRPLESEALVAVIFTWKETRTGKLLIDRQRVEASGSYSSFMGQDYDYAIRAAVNKAAEKVVEQMQNPW